MKEYIPYSKRILTPEVIAKMKADKQAEIKQTKEEITRTLHELFAPIEGKGGMEGFMHHVNTGIAMYDGVCTGIKIIQRVKRYFRKKKK